MPKINRLFILLLVAGLYQPLVLFAADEDDHGVTGIAAGLSVTSTSINLVRWVSPRLALIPSASLLWVEDGGTDWGLGFGMRFYRHPRQAVYPYTTVGLGVLGLAPESGDATTDYLLGIGYGGEYFPAKMFSLGVEIQLNLTVSDDESYRFGNPGGANINTATMIYATLYLK
jgi:hypothetical protein